MGGRVAALALILVCACGRNPPPVTEAPISEERALLQTLRHDAGAAPRDVSNARSLDAVAANLGRRLFHDPSFSGPLIDGDNDGSAFSLGHKGEPGRVSCGGCHMEESGFVDTRSRGKQVSLASRWVMRRTPTLLDIAFSPLFGWGGRHDSMWALSVAVFENNRELNSGRLFVAEQAFRFYRADYEALFGTMPPLEDEVRFPPLLPGDAGCKKAPVGLVFTCRGMPGDGADYDGMSADDQRLVTEVTVNVAKAISAYVETLRCGRSRFDAWLDGDATALGEAEQRGAALFVGRAGCVQCHSGPRLTDGKFHNVGLNPKLVVGLILDSGDRGAGEDIAAALNDPLNSRGPHSAADRGMLPAEVTPAMEGAFRTPGLRCVAEQPSFMHTAHMRTLTDVVEFFNRGGDASGYPGTTEIAPLALSEGEVADLVAFIGALQAM